MIKLKTLDIFGLYNQFLSIKESIDNLQEIITNDRTLGPLYRDLESMKNLLRSYENARINIESIRTSIDFSLDMMIIPEKSFDQAETEGILYLIKTQCEKALGVLKSKISVKLTEKQKDQLNFIRKEIKEIDLDLKYNKNIELTITHLEKGDYLASALITSRIIVYLFDQIPKDNSENSKEKIKSKIKYLISRGIIDKKQKDQKERIFKYVNSARNYLVHELSYFPEFSDCVTLLGDCVNILKILKKVENLKESNIKPSIIDE